MRPPWIVHDQDHWLWVYVAVEPRSGMYVVLLLPSVRGAWFERILPHLRQAFPDETLGLVCDNAPSHRSKQVSWPTGIMPQYMPPYSPELDLAEQVFKGLRNWLSNRRFADRDALRDALIRELTPFWGPASGGHPDDRLSVVARGRRFYLAIIFVIEYQWAQQAASRRRFTPMPGNGNIFISHTHVDSALCAPLLAALRAWGADYWFATKRMDAGPSIPATIQQAIADRDIFIRICTPAAQRSIAVKLATGAFRGLIAEDIAQHRARRTLINLILDAGYQREPFDHATVFIDATRQPQAAWLADLRKAIQTRGRKALPIVAPEPSTSS